MPTTVSRRTHNRIAAIMLHTSRYAFEGQARLAADAGISRSAVSRVLSGFSEPSVYVLLAITGALEIETGRRIDVRDLISADGTYPTPFVCDVVGCMGCLPEQALDEHGNRQPEYAGVKPGQWVGDNLVVKEDE
ncbi:MAG TPA: helix-turn-helix transcriptional regulator [Armatimonadota bacterium]|jgi:transcriptional regulator with XRE-family HTH domain